MLAHMRTQLWAAVPVSCSGSSPEYFTPHSLRRDTLLEWCLLLPCTRPLRARLSSKISSASILFCSVLPVCFPDFKLLVFFVVLLIGTVACSILARFWGQLRTIKMSFLLISAFTNILVCFQVVRGIGSAPLPVISVHDCAEAEFERIVCIFRRIRRWRPSEEVPSSLFVPWVITVQTNAAEKYLKNRNDCFAHMRHWAVQELSWLSTRDCARCTGVDFTCEERIWRSQSFTQLLPALIRIGSFSIVTIYNPTSFECEMTRPLISHRHHSG